MGKSLALLLICGRYKFIITKLITLQIQKLYIFVFRLKQQVMVIKYLLSPAH
jgi:hypothetical protein